MNIIEAIQEKRLFKPFFKNIATWESWLTYLRALNAFSEPNPADLKLFNDSTSLSEWPSQPYRESYVIAGRRSGKSTITAVIGCHLAFLVDWTETLGAGEKGHIFIVATNKSQARIIRNYIEAIIDTQPHFKRMVKKVLAEEIELKNGVVIAVKAASFRSLRGFTVLAGILEELSFWRFEESANPDVEIIRALRPALVKEGLLIGISTPYSKSGFLYDQFSEWHGKAGGPLVWRADTSTMNPSYDKAKIELAYKSDPVSAASEYGAMFREDTSNYCAPEVIKACVVPGRIVVEPKEGILYSGFMDMSGGRSDSYTLGIAHRSTESGRILIDCAVEKFHSIKPSDVVDEFSTILKSYGLNQVKADSYAGAWVTSSFAKSGIQVDNTKKSKAQIYLEFLPLLENGSVELLDVPRLFSQLKALDRRARAGGKDLVDNFHGHDDVCNSVAGAAVEVATDADDGPSWTVSTKTPEREIEKDKKFDEDDESESWIVGSSAGGKRKKGDTRLPDGGEIIMGIPFYKKKNNS